MNTNDYNVWIRQPLFAGELYEVDEQKWEHETVFIREEGSDDIQVHFQPVPQKTSEKKFFPKLLNKSKMSKRKQKKRIKTPKRNHFQSLALVPILMIQILILRKS